ncbi:metallothionein-like protein type 3 [Primulina huaijiensis]|uniref:metallothionein-like protein type 3 n=1 Tax=Primulina huaijiensis TaxID=1492673 RepID=UPI003CC795C6
MSDMCGNCDCADKTQCVKKGYTADIIVTENISEMSLVMDTPVAEHDGKCKCGASCACTNCTCGN